MNSTCFSSGWPRTLGLRLAPAGDLLQAVVKSIQFDIHDIASAICINKYMYGTYSASGMICQKYKTIDIVYHLTCLFNYIPVNSFLLKVQESSSAVSKIIHYNLAQVCAGAVRIFSQDSNTK